MTTGNPVVDVLIGGLLVLGALVVLASAVAMMWARDALTRINVFSPATGLGLPLIVVGAYGHELAVAGFTAWGLFQMLLTILALIVVSSVGSNTLARAAYASGSPVDPRTTPQDLARDPESTPPS